MISGSLFSSTVIGQRNKFDDYAIFLGGKIEVNAQVWSGSEGISNGYTLSKYFSNIFYIIFSSQCRTLRDRSI
nr:DUF3573 domain-containing protein [Francisella noatunensis]